MTDDPLSRLQSRSGVHKRESESVREYVGRVGQEEGVDSELIDAAIDYVTRWQYARTSPGEDRGFEQFLDALDPQAPQDEPPATDPGTQPSPGDESRVPAPDVEPAPDLTPLRAERRATRSDFKGGLRGREPRTLLLRFVVLVGMAPILGAMIARSWVPGHEYYGLLFETAGTIFGIANVAAIELLGSLGLGLYVGLLVLLLADVKKRVQGVLLAAGSALALGVMAVMGVFVPNLDLAAPLNLFGLGIGVLAGILVEAGTLRNLDWEASSIRRPTLETDRLAEFRVAGLALYGILLVVILATILQAAQAGVLNPYDPVAAAAFVYVGYQFIQYESETQYVTLGPAGAGKSMLLLGITLELQAAGGPRPNPNEALQSAIERVSNLQPGNAHWPIPSTPPDELDVASVEVIVGYWFPRRLELTALDYAGQHLARVAELVRDGDTGGESVPARVARWVSDSDTLVVVLDVERLAYPQKFEDVSDDDADISWGLEHYATIIEALDPEEVVVVATKCDILIDQGRVDAPTVAGSFEAFRESVTQELATRPDVTELLELAGEQEIHPTYYATQRSGQEYTPRLDEHGNLMPAGFGHLIAEFRDRQ